MKQNTKAAETAKKEAEVKGAVIQRQMQTVIVHYAFLVQIVLPLAVCFGLRMLAAYIDCDLIYRYDTPLVEVLYLVLSYLILIGTAVFRYAGYGILGYSVLRYGVRPSLAPIFLTLGSAAIVNLSGIAETVYTYGASYVSSELSYVLPLWLINFALALFSELCVIYLCGMVRSAFARHGRLRIGITKEDKEARKKNVLRRLYLYIFLLLLAFSAVSAAMDIYANIRDFGGPESWADWYILSEPIIETVLLSTLGLWVSILCGAHLTKKNEALSKATLT